MSKRLLSMIAVLGWGVAAWTPVPLPLVILGAMGFWTLRDAPRWAAAGALFAGLSQVAWVVDAWTLSGRGAPWVYPFLALWQATGPLFAVLLVHRLRGGPVRFGLCWGAAQALVDTTGPLPALHATLAAAQPWAIWPAAFGGPALATGVLAGLGAWLVERPRAGALALGLHLVVGGGLSLVPSAGRTVVAGVVQPDLHALDTRPSLAEARQQQLIELMQREEVDLWALPEGAWPHDPGDHPGSRRRAFEAALQGLPPLVTGATVDGATNSLVAHPWDRLDKAVLVPVWERSWLGLGEDRYRPGHGGAQLDVGSVRVGGLICYEDVVWRRVQRAAGAELLVAATNDSWNGPGAGSALHLAQARLVAVSTGLWVLRPALNGPSAILSPWGTAVWSAPWVESGPGRVGTARITVGRAYRPGRWALLWDACVALLVLARWRRWSA